MVPGVNRLAPILVLLLGCSPTTVVEEFFAAPDASPEPGFRDSGGSADGGPPEADVPEAAADASPETSDEEAPEAGVPEAASCRGCVFTTTISDASVCFSGSYDSACGSRGAPCVYCVPLGLACVGDAGIGSFACR
jgi:hypothetical protein